MAFSHCTVVVIVLSLMPIDNVLCTVSWDNWWTYNGISGPAFWGLINPEWNLCNKGRRQSPINLEPTRLLFDPNLMPLELDNSRMNGVLMNTGHSVMFAIDDANRNAVNISGGPLSYKYQFQELHIRYGVFDKSGSEHKVNDYSFPAELQIYGFNSQLYRNFEDAMQRSQGLVAISVLLQIGDLSNPELRVLTDKVEQLKYRGNRLNITQVSLNNLLPNTKHYMTYDGSVSMPPCYETVTWIVMNKPIYITKQQVQLLRNLLQNDVEGTLVPLGDNFRPTQPIYNRPIRTNINFQLSKIGNNACPTMKKEIFYTANQWIQE